MQTNEATLDQLNRYTIAIQKAGSDSVLGTGVIVTDDGLIVTCYHVVGDIKTKTLDKSVDVYFPSVSEIKGHADVLEEYSDSELDIAFLQLQEKMPDESTVAILSEAIEDGHTFKSFGFRKSQTFYGLNSYGRIDGKTRKKLEENKLSPELIQLYSDGIDHGMSGATVLDTSINRVIGIVSEYFATSTNIDRNLALAIPVESIVKVYPELKQKNEGLKELTQFLEKIGKSTSGIYDRFDEKYVPPVEYHDIKKILKELDVYSSQEQNQIFLHLWETAF